MPAELKICVGYLKDLFRQNSFISMPDAYVGSGVIPDVEAQGPVDAAMAAAVGQTSDFDFGSCRSTSFFLVANPRPEKRFIVPIPHAAKDGFP